MESQSLFTEIVSNNAHAIRRDLLTARLMLVVISVSLFCRPRLLKGWTVLSCFHRTSNTKIVWVTHSLNNLAKLSHTDIISGRPEHMKWKLLLVLYVNKRSLLLKSFGVSKFFVCVFAVNIGQAAFESLTQIVDRLHQLLENSQDEHGRNQLLSSYITYVFSAPYSYSPTSSPDHRSGHSKSLLWLSSICQLSELNPPRLK